MLQFMDLLLRRRVSNRGENGQMAVEMAVVLPVILALMIVSVDGMLFESECARFDHVASQQVLACMVSPAKDSYALDARLATLQAALEEEFSGSNVQVSVDASGAGTLLASMVQVTCVYQMTPWPFSASNAFVPGPAVLSHEMHLVVDPYTPGELL